MASDSAPCVRLADQALDPALQVASAPFATWIGTIQVDAAGHARLLRGTGDEDHLPTIPEHGRAVEQAYEAAGEPLRAGTGTWLPLGDLYPVLTHLDASEAFDVTARMPAPRAEHLAVGDRPVPLTLRAAMLDGVAGWAGGVREDDGSAESPC